ncbi:DUF4126 domain-containing protein [Flavisphingomonas formosensis]|uniref:DUF4126 domain-containing protein n=1 Tax=Flavisphingomonas formosensis TaxID=861534 RepID=UPI0018DF2FE5|nr:DUF4126 domain-containing protein [Sphingomonas formosensis]
MIGMTMLALAIGVALIAGWRLYLCIVVVGLTMHAGWLDFPAYLYRMGIVADPWVLGSAAALLIVETVADKIRWLDSLWDAVHTVIRPLGAALLALAIGDPPAPLWQVGIFLLGGAAGLYSHAAKATMRALANAAARPLNTVLLSLAEDIAAVLLLAIALLHPFGACGVATLMLLLDGALLLAARGRIRRLLGGEDGLEHS